MPGFIEFDEKNRVFQLDKDLFLYEQFQAIECSQDGVSVLTGQNDFHRAGNAVKGSIAGALLGPVGMVAGGALGASVGKGGSTEFLNSFTITVTLSNAHVDTMELDLIPYLGMPIVGRFKVGGRAYKSLVSSVNSCVDEFNIISSSQWQNVSGDDVSDTSHEQQSDSAADEILKFKQLLDAGILTQEEFDAKKAQLLGL